LRNRWLPQHAQDHHPFARQMVGKRVALGAPADEGAHRGRLGGRLFRRQFVFRGAGFQLFAKSSASWSISRAERSDRCPQTWRSSLAIRSFCAAISAMSSEAFARDRQFRRHFQAPRALGDQRRLQRRRDREGPRKQA